jgi:hypothetical protein
VSSDRTRMPTRYSSAELRAFSAAISSFSCTQMARQGTRTQTHGHRHTDTTTKIDTRQRQRHSNSRY